MKRLTASLVAMALGLAAFPASSLALDYFTNDAALSSGAIHQGFTWHGYYTFVDTFAHSGYSGLPGVYLNDSNNVRVSAYQTCDTTGCDAALSWAPGASSSGYAVSKNHGGFSSHFDGREDS